MKDYKYIGKYIPMHDIKEKVTGKLKYVDDIDFPGMLHAKLLYSTIAHGKIKSIDTSEAEKVPGVVKIVTYKNSPDIYYNSNQWYEGIKLIKDEKIFSDTVKFYGDRVAAVIAIDERTAEYAKSLIKVEYEEEKAILDMEEAIKIKDNLISQKKIQCGDFESIIKDADFISEDIIKTQRVHHLTLEPHVCISYFHEYGNLTILSPCQVVFQVRLVVAQALGLPTNKVRVIKAPIGGSFGAKSQPVIEPLCAYFTKITGKPVKLKLTREEAIVSTRTRHSVIGKVKIATDKEGKILGRTIYTLVDAGAYVTNSEQLTMAMGKKTFRLYRIQNQTYTSDIVHTNTPVGGVCRGYGSPQITAISEISMENTARRLNIDPLEFRLKNLVYPYDKDPTGGPDLGNAGIRECVIKGAQAFNWKEKYSRPKDEGRFRRGVGMACGAHGNGYFGAYPDFITMTMYVDELGYIIVKSALHDLGCGTVTTIKQIIAETLDVDIERIIVYEGDTFISPYDSAGTQASRVTYVCGGAAVETSKLLKKKILSTAAKLLNVTEEDLSIEDGYVINKTNFQKTDISEIALLSRQKLLEELIVTNTYKAPANPASYVANFAEVEVDTLTGEVKILDFVSANDIGQSVNKVLVEGQIHGSIQMAIGFALYEELNIDNKGRVTTNSLSKYHVVNAPQMPNIRIILVENKEELGPYGAKSIGEVATIAAAPAIINAINHALDTNICTLPATPERIIKALKVKEGY